MKKNLDYKQIKKPTLDLIRLYAIDKIYGLKNADRYQQNLEIINDGDDYKIYINQHANLNTWGQGDILVVIDPSTSHISLSYKDIDGENWGKSWYVNVNLSEQVDLDTLIKNAQPLFIKNLEVENGRLLERLNKEIEKSSELKGKNFLLNSRLQLANERISELQEGNYSLESDLNKKFSDAKRTGFNQAKDFYFIPFLSRIKSYFVSRSIKRKIKKEVAV